MGVEIINEVDREFITQAKKAQQISDQDILENALPGEKLELKTLQFCRDILGQNPLSSNNIPDKLLKFSSHHPQSATIEFSQTIHHGWTENTGRIDCLTGMITQYRNNNLLENRVHEYIRDPQEASINPEIMNWISIVDELPAKPLTQSEAFEKALPILEYYNLPTEMNQYKLNQDHKKNWEFKKKFEYNGVWYAGKEAQFTISRQSGELVSVYYTPIKKTKERPSQVISKEKAYSIASKYHKRVNAMHFFKKKDTYNPFNGKFHNSNFSDVEPVLLDYYTLV